jgi:hypothetical protein
MMRQRNGDLSLHLFGLRVELERQCVIAPLEELSFIVYEQSFWMNFMCVIPADSKLL